MFGSLVESIEIQGMRCVSGIANNGVGVSAYRSEEARHCHGGAILIPVHWNEMVRRGACEVSDGHRLAEFVFHQLEQPGAPFDSGVVTELTVTRDGLVHGMLVWWEVKLLSKALDPEGKVSYSTAADAEQEWQDHWVQVVMPFAEIHSAVIGDVFKVALYNNGVNMWLELLSINHARTGGIKRKAAELADSSLREEVDPGTGPALCSCGWHLLCGARMCCVSKDLC